MPKDLKVNSIMTRKLVTCSPDTQAAGICQLMGKNRCGSVLVKDGDEYVGIITMQDIVKLYGNQEDSSGKLASEIMSKPLQFVHEEDSVERTMEFQEETGIRRTPVKDSEGNVTGIVTQTDLVHASLEYMHNYTSNLEQEVNARTKEMLRLAQAKNEFIGTVAHDLRNPLTVIQMWAEMTLMQTKDILPPESREGLEQIVRQTDVMLNLINNLLDVSIIEAGKVRWNIFEFDLCQVLESVVKMHNTAAEKKGITFHCDLPDKLPTIKGDRDRLRSVVENLVSNAIKFCSGGDSVKVCAYSENSHVKVDIVDTGPGLSEDDIKKLFTPFSKASNQPTGDEPSTGLGLAIAKKVVEHHGGKIWVEAVLDEGSVFSFTIPTNA